MKSVYLLCVFYNTINKAELARIPPRLNQVSDGDHIAIEYDSNRAAFAFTSILGPREVAKSFVSLGSENLRYLVIGIDSVVCGNVAEKVQDWFLQRLGAAPK